MITFQTPVLADWIDYNGHLRDAYYFLIFSYATDSLMARIGLDEEGRARTQHTLYTLEAHINYVAEAKIGEALAVRTDFVDVDSKRLHILHNLERQQSGELIAASEQMLMNIDTRTAKGQAFEPSVADRIKSLFSAHPTPEPLKYCGQIIRIRR